MENLGFSLPSIRTPKKTHWSGNGLPAAQEAATVLVAIGATRNIAKFMMADGLDKIAEIQQLTRETISLYAKTCRKNLSGSDIVSTRFILDLKKATFKMTHIKNRISRIIDPVDIDKKWCRSMNDQIELEQGWNNYPLKDLYPTQALLTNSTKWMEILQNVLRMIHAANCVPLAAVIRKRIVPRPESDDIAFGLQYSEYASHDDEMIERAPIINHETFDRNATDKELDKTGPFEPRYLAAHSHAWTVIKGCIGSNNKLNIQLNSFNNTTDGRGAYFAIEAFLLGNDHASYLISTSEKGSRETTFTTNIRSWKIEDYITKHIEFYSVIDDQKALGKQPGMYKNQRVDLLLDGLKNKALGGVKSNILCHSQLYNDFNATVTHLKDLVNHMPELQTAPDHQVSAMGRGGGSGRGTGRGGCDGRGGRDRRGGRGFYSGRGIA